MNLNARYKQSTLARKIYCEGFQSDSYSFELGLLALYLRDVKKLKVSERKLRLEEFCQRYYPCYHPRADYKLVERALKLSIKKESCLVELDGVRMYRGELEAIDTLSEDDNERRMMYALLLRKKIDRAAFERRHVGEAYKSYLSHPVKESTLKAVAKQARIPKKTDVFDEVLHGLMEKKLIEFMPRGNMLLHYVNELPACDTEEDSVWIPVSGFESAGLYYDYFKGNKHVALCEECRMAFWKNSNRQKYCAEHSPDRVGKPDRHARRCTQCGEYYWTANKNVKDTGICAECSGK